MSLYLYSAAETLGCAGASTKKCSNRQIKYPPSLIIRHSVWADIGVIGSLVDRAAIVEDQVALCRTSYGPYARAMVKICRREFSPASGFEACMALAQGGELKADVARRH
ncbi:Phenylacetic acid catabolic protein [Escherichia coli]